MALAYVLWIVALLTLLVGGLETAAQNQLLLSRNLQEQTRAEALAEGAIALAMADIARLPPDKVLLGPRVIILPTGKALLTVTDLGGLVDVNTARPALLERTFVTAGATAALAADLTARIVARREASGAPVLLLDELHQAPGVSHRLFRRLADLLTTQGGQQVVDPGVAPAAVLLALADFDEGEVERYLATRAQAGRFAPLAAADAGPVIGAGFEIRAEVESESGGRIVRTAVVKPARLGDPDPGIRLVDWRNGPAG
jgi:general secretion pathway protein K